MVARELKRILCILVVAGIPGLAGAPRAVLKPVDEAPQNREFLAFRTHLKEIIARRDTKALLDVVDPEIRASFGSDHGISAFAEMWKLNERDSDLWKELLAVLELGGTFDSPSAFTAPYTFSRWPDGIDPFEFMAVTGSSVRVRKQPGTHAPILGTVSYAILEADLDAKSVDGWTAIKFEGKRGYIASQFLRSPIDYRARFERENGRWRMAFFLAGD